MKKKILRFARRKQPILVSIVVSIPACHAGDRGSIPRKEGLIFKIFFTFSFYHNYNFFYYLLIFLFYYLYSNNCFVIIIILFNSFGDNTIRVLDSLMQSYTVTVQMSISDGGSI